MKLHHLILGRADAPRSAFLIHGILGSSRNWRQFGRRLLSDYPDWSFVLVDLRGHGDSPTGPEHTLTACANDLAVLASALVQPPCAVIGHSFGGKVALQYAQDHGDALKQIWVLDAPPDGDFHPTHEDNEVTQVVDFLATLQVPFATRAEVNTAIITAGFSNAIGQWMTTNLQRGESGYTWRFDLPTIRDLLDSYYQTDFYDFLSGPHPPITFIRAERGDRWPTTRVRRIEACPNTSTHLLLNSGHWVHVDNPSGLLEALQLDGSR